MSNLIGLVTTGSCPWCKGTQRHEVSNLFSFSDDSNHYLDEIAIKLNLTSNDLISKMTEWECLECTTRYLDPWLDSSLGRWLFHSMKSTHRAGWGNFLSEINVKKSKQFALAEGFLKLVSKKGLTIVEYWELGCPFFGFLIPFYRMKRGLSNQSFTNNFQFFLEQHASRNNYGKRRIYKLFEQTSFKVLHYYSRFSHSIVGNKKENLSPNKISGNLKLGYWKTTEDFFWDPIACFGESVSCGVVSTNFLELNVGIPEQGAEPIFVALHNFLDHTKDPRYTLESTMSRADLILLVSHTEGQIGKQHQYSFGDNLKNYVLGKGWNFENITKDLFSISSVQLTSTDDSFFLLSKGKA